ncbi:MAG: hypothetical protein ACTSWY_05040 [Promethearchaeota archaeon]
MLLRFSFRWTVQRDETAKICPYCGEKLEIEYRSRKVLKVDLNFKEDGCIIGGTRSQIGINYHEAPIKSTINPRGIANYLQNYQNLYINKILGPFLINVEN